SIGHTPWRSGWSCGSVCSGCSTSGASPEGWPPLGCDRRLAGDFAAAQGESKPRARAARLNLRRDPTSAQHLGAHPHALAVEVDPGVEPLTRGKAHRALDALVGTPVRLARHDALVIVEPSERRGGGVERVDLAVDGILPVRALHEARIAAE